MELFKISQVKNNGCDTYDSAVVAAPDEDTAKMLDPYTGEIMTNEDWNDPYTCWVSSPDFVIVEHLGKAAKNIKQGVICASFNAG